LEEKARGLAAKSFLVDTLELSDDIELQSHGTGKYGRVLGTFFNNGVDINQLMVKEGHAIEYNV
jgi:endonuclease YncB( thermonuclease family)